MEPRLIHSKHSSQALVLLAVSQHLRRAAGYQCWACVTTPKVRSCGAGGFELPAGDLNRWLLALWEIQLWFDCTYVTICTSWKLAWMGPPAGQARQHNMLLRQKAFGLSKCVYAALPASRYINRRKQRTLGHSLPRSALNAAGQLATHCEGKKPQWTIRSSHTA